MKGPTINWIDWMKVLGMTFIVWGHCFPETMSAFIYAFNVPVFFIISGFLTHGREEGNVFFPKFLKTLVVPYLLLAFIKGAGAILGGVESGEWWKSIVGILLGFHTFDGAQGCSNLWFVYTLLFIRLLHHFIGGNLKVLWFLSIMSLAISFVLSLQGVELPAWAITDTLLALPFFTLGRQLRSVNPVAFNRFTTAVSQSSAWKPIIAALLLFVLTWFLSFNNGGGAMLFEGYYGESLLLFLLSALTGSMALLLLSLVLDKVRSRALRLLAISNLVTLTFHREILHTPLKMISQSDIHFVMKDVSTACLSVATMICFIPIAWIVTKYMPILVGGRKIG